MSCEVRQLISHPEIQHLRYMAVIDGTNAVGTLDLDRARGKVRHSDPNQNLLVKHVFEPVNADNYLRGDSSLIDYILTADVRPFRLVELAGHKLGTIDVADLQKLPVRVLLFMTFSHLETLLARQMCIRQPRLLDIARTDPGLDTGSLGNTGSGPERRIERYKFGTLLRSSKREGFITIQSEEIRFLERYRNNIAHGPRWYITRRGEVASLVNCLGSPKTGVGGIGADSAGPRGAATAKGQLRTDPRIPLPGRACGGLLRMSGAGSYGTAGVSTRYARPPLGSGPSDDTPAVPPLREQLWALRPGLDGGVPAVDDFTPDARGVVGAWA